MTLNGIGIDIVKNNRIKLQGHWQCCGTVGKSTMYLHSQKWYYISLWVQLTIRKLQI